MRLLQSALMFLDSTVEEVEAEAARAIEEDIEVIPVTAHTEGAVAGEFVFISLPCSLCF